MPEPEEGRGQAVRLQERFLKALVGRVQKQQANPSRDGMAEARQRMALSQNGILDDASPHINPHLLRQLADENPIVQAILKTKQNLVVPHFRRPETEKGLGARVVQKSRPKSVSPAAAKRAQELEEIVRQGGIPSVHPVTGREAVWDGNFQRCAFDLETAVRLLTHDALVLDREFISIEGSVSLRGKQAQPVMFWTPEDAALMRYTNREKYHPRYRPELVGQIEYVMLDPMLTWVPQREYLYHEGAMTCRNPRTVQQSFGYGQSELQQCWQAVLGIQYAAAANQKWFTDSHIPQGILTLIGDYGADALDNLRAEIEAEVGPNNPYKIPMLQAPAQSGNNVLYTPFVDRTRLDMVFRAWAEWCVAEVCAVFQIAPEEIGFTSFGRGGAVLSEADPESIINQSQHKGLLPLVLHLCGFLSRSIVERIDPDFELIIQGLEERYTPEMLQREQLDLARKQKGLPLNRIQALSDLEPLYDPLDRALWEQIEQALQEQPFVTERERQEAVKQAYQAAGGQLGDCYEAPTGDPGMLQIWMEQHLKPQMDAQQQMGQMAMGDYQNQAQGGQQEQQALQGQMGQMAMGDYQAQQAQDQALQGQMGEQFAREDGRQAEGAKREQEDRDQGMMRVPPAEDAGEFLSRKKKVKKALALGGVHRIRIIREED